MVACLYLASYGSTRATIDLNLLIQEDDKKKLRAIFKKNGFTLIFESTEVLQFTGTGYVDVKLARRPIFRQILQNATLGGPENIRFAQAEDLIGLKIQAYFNDRTCEFQDKADIQYLIENVPDLHWNIIKTYVDIFSD